jgi:RimJ/RimL family protein N-acetyltransferase
MPLPDDIVTERLLLRAPIEADAVEVFARYAQDINVCRYMSWAPHRSIDDTISYLQSTVQGMEAGRQMNWLIRERASGHLLGSIGYGYSGHRTDFGFCLARNAWGQGFAAEAARVVGNVALNEPGIYRVAALCDVENKASARVLEKAGFQLEGVLRRYYIFPNLEETPRDVYCFSRIR